MVGEIAARLVERGPESARSGLAFPPPTRNAARSYPRSSCVVLAALEGYLSRGLLAEKTHANALSNIHNNIGGPKNTGIRIDGPIGSKSELKYRLTDFQLQ
jgi:hypothetical protein